MDLNVCNVYWNISNTDCLPYEGSFAVWTYGWCYCSMPYSSKIQIPCMLLNQISIFIYVQICLCDSCGWKDLWALLQLQNKRQISGDTFKKIHICMQRQIFCFHNETHGDLTIWCLLYLLSLVKNSVENSQQSAHIVHFPVLQWKNTWWKTYRKNMKWITYDTMTSRSYG